MTRREPPLPYTIKVSKRVKADLDSLRRAEFRGQPIELTYDQLLRWLIEREKDGEQ